MKHNRIFRMLIATLLCLTMVTPSLADVLILPAKVKIISEEAFYEDTSLDEVVLPEGVEEIGPRAFARSSVTKINLPDSLTEIADDAFDLDADTAYSANPDTYAWDWLYENGLDEEQRTHKSFLTIGLTFVHTDPALNYTVDRHWATNGADFSIVGLIDDYIAETLEIGNQKVLWRAKVQQGEEWVHLKMEKGRGRTLLSDIFYCDDTETGELRQGEILFTAGVMKCIVYFHQGSNGPATGIQLNKNEESLIVGGRCVLSATIQPEFPADSTVTWYSSDESVATVNYNGVVRAVAPGQAVITAETANGLTAECRIYVTPERIPVQEILLEGPETILYEPGQTGSDTITVRVLPEDATEPGYTWSSSDINEEYASITPEGVVTVWASGTVTFTATANDGSGAAAEITIEAVRADTPEEEFELCIVTSGKRIAAETTEAYSAEQGDLTIGTGTNGIRLARYAGKTAVKIFLTDEEPDFTDETQIDRRVGDLLADEEVTDSQWLSMQENETGFSISRTDLERARYLQVMVGLYQNEKSEEVQRWSRFAIEIKKGEIPAESVTLDRENVQMFMGDICTLKADVQPENASDREITWSSENENVATVDENGVVTALSIGYTTITAQTTNHIEAYCLVEVQRRPADTSIEGFVFEENDDGSATLTEYTGDDPDVVIPSVDGLNRTVKYIGAFAFSDKPITSIYIPDSVEGLRACAFCGCSSLTEVRLSENLRFIGDDGEGQVFQGCASLAAVDIPASVRRIGFDAFCGCGELTEVTLHEGLTYIGGHAFSGCENLAEISLPRSMRSIEDNAFERAGITHIDIPDTVISIGQRAFDSCPHLTSVVIPDSVVSLGGYAFHNCPVLAEIQLSETLTAIKESTFESCEALSSVTIPNSVKNIESRAFYCCTKLKSVTLPSQLKIINDYLFFGCETLSHIEIPDGVETIGDSAFFYCTALKSVRFPASLKTIKKSAFDTTGLTGITLPDGTLTLEDYAFLGCEKLNRANLPDSIRSIGESCFEGCRVLYSVRWPASTYVLSANVLSGCTSLYSVVLHDNITDIGGRAFNGCKTLSSVHIPQAIETIGEYAFADSGIVSVNIPDNILSIGECAFSGCIKLASVTFPDTLTSIGEYAFTGCETLRRITLPAGLVGIPDGLFYYCSNLSSVTIPDSVQMIGNDSFGNCGDLTFVNIPDSVRAIGRSAFYYCSSLKTLRIPSGVLSIGDDAFIGCNEKLTIYGTAGSAAEDAAKEYDFITFVAVGDGGAEGSATVLSVQFESTAIDVGTELEFTVATSNATHVILRFEGEAYNQYPVDEYGMVHASRMIYKAMDGTRLVSFAAVNGTESSEPTQDYVITVYANGPLDTPEASWNEIIRRGEEQIIRWSGVNYADGFALYLNQPDGRITQIDLTGENYSHDEANHSYSYTFPADSFEKAGDYSLRLMAYGEGYSQSSRLCPFTVRETMAAAEIDLPESAALGEDLTFTLKSVENASSYQLSLYGEDGENPIWYESITQEQLAEYPDGKITIDGLYLLQAGLYGITAVVKGTDFQTQETTKAFSIEESGYHAEIVTPADGNEFIAGDTFHISMRQSGGGYARIVVSGPAEAVFPREEESGLTEEEEYRADMPVLVPGEYMITAAVYASADAQMPAAEPHSIHVKVKGPASELIRVGRRDRDFTWIEKNVDGMKAFIRANDATDRVLVSENGTTCTASFDAETGIYTAELPDTAPGRHQITVTAYDDDAVTDDVPVSTSSPFEFYIAQGISPKKLVYPISDTVLKSSPINGSNEGTVSGGAWFVPLRMTHEAGDWIKVETPDGKKNGFIRKSDVSENLPKNASGKIEIMNPPEGGKTESGAASLSVSWRAGLMLSEQPVLTWSISEAGTRGSRQETTTGYGPSSLDISGLSEGLYDLSVSVPDVNGQTYTANRCFQIGQHTKEEQYREWYGNVISKWEDYDFYFGISGGENSGGEIGRLKKLHSILRTGYLCEGAHFLPWKNWKEGQHHNSTIYDADKETARDALIVVQNAVKKDEERGKLILAKDYSNMNQLIRTRQNNEYSEKLCETIFDGVKASVDIASEAFTISAVATGATASLEEVNKIKDFVFILLDFALDVAQDAVSEWISEYDARVLLAAYLDEYRAALSETCEDYVNYLEKAYFAGCTLDQYESKHTLIGNQIAAATYIRAFRKYQEAIDSMPDGATYLTSSNKYLDNKGVQEALAALGKHSGLDFSSVSGANKKGNDFILSLQEAFPEIVAKAEDRVLEMFANFFAELFFDQEFVGAFKIFGTIPAKEALKEVLLPCLESLIEIHYEDGLFRIETNADAMFTKLDQELRRIGLTFGPEMLLQGFIMAASKVDVGQAGAGLKLTPHMFVNVDSNIEAGFVGTVHDMIAEAWETGTSIGTLLNDVDQLASIGNGRTALISYAGLFYSGMGQREQLLMESREDGGIDLMVPLVYYLEKLDINTYDVKELERLRACLITLANLDLGILDSYQNMKTIFENNPDWYFSNDGDLGYAHMPEKNYGLDSFIQTWQIEADRKRINDCKVVFTDVPDTLVKFVQGINR